MHDFTRYTTAVDHLYANLDKMIKDNLFSGRNVYLFGSSKISSMIISYLQKHGIAPCGIIDNNKATVGSTVFHLKIYSPSLLEEKKDDKVLVLIASGFQDEMIAQLEGMGYVYGKHIFKVIDLPAEMDDYSFFPDRSAQTLLNTDQVKEAMFKTLCGLKRVCDREKISYFLAYGTLLGAVRHKGFIPWDDDIDVWVPITDLERLVEVLKEEKDLGIAGAVNGDMDYFDMVSFVYDCDTIFYCNHFPMQILLGVLIDVFPLFGLPDTKEELYAYQQELKEAELAMLNNMTDKKAGQAAAKELFCLMKKYPLSEAKLVGNILSGCLLKDAFPRECFEKSTELEFEHNFFRAPAGYDSVLRSIYGDYMQLPPEEKRVGHHFFHAYRR